MSTDRPSHPEACPKCDERAISSVITSSRSQTQAMAQPILPRPVRALAALAALLVLAGCQADTAPAAKSERPVQIQRVSFQDADGAREFVGVVRPRYETDLGFRVAGKIVTRVVIAAVPSPTAAAVPAPNPGALRCRRQAPARGPPAAPPIPPQPPPPFSAHPNSKPTAWARVADFDRKKAASDEAQGRLDRARRALDLARNQLTYAELKADADGVITATLAEAGQVVAVGQPVARLAHHGEKEAVVALPE